MYYRLKKDGVTLCIAPSLLRCRRQSNGVVVVDPKGDGVVFEGNVYNLPGYGSLEVEEIADLRDVIAEKVDTAAVSIAFVKLAEGGQIDGETAARHSTLFLPWAAPVHYAAGQIVRADGTLWRCLQAHTSQEDWRPAAAPALWRQISDPTAGWPAWSQPVCAADAYAAGARVVHDGKHWISTQAANVWEPGVYGWEEQP